MKDYFFINHDSTILVFENPVSRLFDKYRPFKQISIFEIITKFGEEIPEECYEKRYVKLSKQKAGVK